MNGATKSTIARVLVVHTIHSAASDDGTCVTLPPCPPYFHCHQVGGHNNRMPVFPVAGSPSLGDIVRLLPGEAYRLTSSATEEDHYYVRAHLVKRSYILFTCPFCWSSYRDDGTPRPRARRVVHKVRNPDGDALTERFLYAEVTPRMSCAKTGRSFYVGIVEQIGL